MAHHISLGSRNSFDCKQTNNQQPSGGLAEGRWLSSATQQGNSLALHWGLWLSTGTSTEDRTAVSDLDEAGHLLDLDEGLLELGARVTGRDAEAAATEDNGGGGEANGDNGHVALKALAGKGQDLGRVVKEHGDDGRVVVAIDMDPHFDELAAEVVGVVLEVSQLLSAHLAALLARDDTEGGDHLAGEGRLTPGGLRAGLPDWSTLVMGPSKGGWAASKKVVEAHTCWQTTGDMALWCTDPAQDTRRWSMVALRGTCDVSLRQGSSSLPERSLPERSLPEGPFQRVPSRG